MSSTTPEANLNAMRFLLFTIQTELFMIQSALARTLPHLQCFAALPDPPLLTGNEDPHMYNEWRIKMKDKIAALEFPMQREVRVYYLASRTTGLAFLCLMRRMPNVEIWAHNSDPYDDTRQMFWDLDELMRRQSGGIADEHEEPEATEIHELPETGDVGSDDSFHTARSKA